MNKISEQKAKLISESKTDLSLLLPYAHTDNNDMFGHLLVNDSPQRKCKYFFQAEVSN